jgi:uncharacterized membrane protein YhhN
MHQRTLVSFVPFLVVTVAHLIELYAGLGLLTFATKVLLMPALLVALFLHVGRRPDRIVVFTTIALTLSWLGDVLLSTPGDSGFVAGLGAFLLAHIVYSIEFFAVLGARPRWWAWALGGVWFVILLAVLAPHLGALLIAVVVYGAALAVMTVAATGLSRMLAIGGALFLASDTLLSLKLFLPGFPFPGINGDIMVLYCAAQGLLLLGVLRARAASSSVIGDSQREG